MAATTTTRRTTSKKATAVMAVPAVTLAWRAQPAPWPQLAWR